MNMMTELNTKEAAAAAGVPLGTLKSWLADGVPIPHRVDTRGGRRYGPDAVEAIRQVAQLRNQDGRNLASICKILKPIPDPAASEPSASPGRDESEVSPSWGPAGARPGVGQLSAEGGPAVNIEDLVDAAAAQLEARMVEVLQDQNELAEKYARAAHQIGQLEAKLEAARADGLRLAESTTKAETELGRVRAELDQVRDELREAGMARVRAAELEAELARVREELAASRPSTGSGPAKSWWKFWA